MNFIVENLGNNYAATEYDIDSPIWIIRVENNKYFDYSPIYSPYVPIFSTIIPKNKKPSLRETLINISKIETKDLHDLTDDLNNESKAWIITFWELIQYVKKDVRKKKLEKLLS